MQTLLQRLLGIFNLLKHIYVESNFRTKSLFSSNQKSLNIPISDVFFYSLEFLEVHSDTTFSNNSLCYVPTITIRSTIKIAVLIVE